MSSVEQSQGASTINSDLDLRSVLISSILSDETFNCRGHISESSIVALAEDLKENGLQNPILVQPWDKDGYDWRIVSGHRRHAAAKRLGWQYIDAIIKEGLSEIDAVILNLGENTQREQLNIMQEARALKHLKDLGLNQSEVARRLKVTRPWVQVRYYVLDMPADIQQEIADGWLNQAQIHQINGMAEADMYATVRAIKTAKINAGTKRLRIKPPPKAKKENLEKAEFRDTDTINLMLDHMIDAAMPGFHTRCLAWAAGNITTVALLEDFKKLCDEQGINYTIPAEGIPGL